MTKAETLRKLHALKDSCEDSELSDLLGDLLAVYDDEPDEEEE